jgi:hypothetical protein
VGSRANAQAVRDLQSKDNGRDVFQLVSYPSCCREWIHSGVHRAARARVSGFVGGLCMT